MGVLTASGSFGDDGPSASQVDSEPEAPEKGGGEPAEPSKKEEKGEFVPYSAVETRRPGSRRAKAAAEVEELINSKLKPMQDEWGTQRQTYEQRISQQAQELAHMRGQFEAMQRMPAPAPAAPAPPGPDPQKLMEEAEKALDERDIRTYHAKLNAAHAAQSRKMADEAAASVRKELEGRIPQQLPPEVQYLMSQHRNVALAGAQGVEAVMIKDRELAFYRVPQGPQRLAKAFELADQFLGSVNGTGGGSSNTAAAQALSGVPTSRPAGGGGGKQGDGVTLSPLQLQTIKDLGWSKEEYVKWMSPERFIKR